jgi:hypothetical protein
LQYIGNVLCRYTSTIGEESNIEGALYLLANHLDSINRLVADAKETRYGSPGILGIIVILNPGADDTASHAVPAN